MIENRTTRLLAITPARDEEKLLPGLIASMAAQTRLPDRWIVIDDGSSDATGKIIEAAARRFPWIEPYHLERNRPRAAGGESVIMQFLPRSDWQNWDYLLRLDADLSFTGDFIDLLLTEFRRDETLGIAGSLLLEPKGAAWREVRVPSFHTRGAAKMYSANCFAAIGGLEVGLGWDTIDELHAMMCGFRTRHFNHIHAYHHRPQGTAASLWRGRLAAGRAAYRSGYSTIYMLVRTGRQIFTWPWIVGATMMLAGYLEGYLRRLPRPVQPELIRFMRRQQLRRLFMRESLWR